MLSQFGMGFGNFGSARALSLAEHFVQRAAGVTVPTVDTPEVTEKYWVLARSRYVVRIVDLAGVPVAKRSGALQLAQAAWTPFLDTAHYVIPQLDGALLCAYDLAAIQQAQAEIDIDATSIKVIPETALWSRDSGNPAPWAPNATTAQTQNVSLIDALDGVVATVGVSGRVVAERWWPNRPTQTEWINFQRGVGVAADERSNDTPPATFCGWQQTPAGYTGGNAQTTTSQREWSIVAIAAWLLIVPTIWFANEWRQLHALKNDAGSRLVATESELDATLGARSQALNGLDRANKLAGLFGQPDGLTTFALVNDVLAQIVKSGVLQLTEWDLRGPQLKFVMIAPAGGAPPATAVVKAFEKVGSIRDVEVSTDGARTSVSLRIISSTSQLTQTDASNGNPSVTQAVGATSGATK